MSEESCRNDCTLPERFPRRPGTTIAVPHGDGCPCCTSDADRISTDNRPALDTFNYRIGTYGSIREFLFNRLNSTAELQTWTHRAPDDPAVALLEGASILGDILTFYQETYANEAFLRTAKWRESVSDLVRLLGYRLSPAVGGRATFAFELKKDEPVTLPAGFPVKANLEDFEKPSDFETIEETTLYPWLGKFNLYRPLQDGDITPSTTEFYISSPEQLTDPIDLKVGDRLLVGQIILSFYPDDGAMWDTEVVIVDSIREQHGRKYYTIKGNLKRTTNISSLSVYRLGRSFHHFGYNSPAVIVNSSAAVTSTAVVNTSTNTTTTTSNIPTITVKNNRPTETTFTDPSVTNPPGIRQYPLDAEIKDLPGRSTMIVEATFRGSTGSLISPARTLFVTVADIKLATLKWGSIEGTVSQLQLYYPLNFYVGNGTTMDITTALFHEVTSPKFTIRRARTETTSPTGNRLFFYGTADQVKTLKDRRVMIEKPDEEPVVMTVVDVPSTFDANTADYPQLRWVDLSADVAYPDFPNDSPTVTVYGNLADGDEGKSMPETPIGSGDATQVFQNFKLPKAPLTYHITPENTPPETPELEVYVSGRLWTQVDSFFGREPDEQIYIVREDAEGNSWVQFGDGKTGARLVSGVNNVTAFYRMGSGSFGALKVDTKVQASAKLKNLDKIAMPADATGGAPAEDADNARAAAPGKVQTLGRIVSLKDFESEAAAIAGVASATAAWELVANIPAVVITVLMETGRSDEIAAVRETLNAYNFARGAGRHPIDVRLGERMYVTASIQYTLLPTYRADLVEPNIRLALGVNYGKATRDEDQSGLFSVRRRRFGKPEYVSTLEGTVQNVEGVNWARATAFLQLSDLDDPADIVVPVTTSIQTVVDCSPAHILSLFDKHLILSAVAEGGNA